MIALSSFCRDSGYIGETTARVENPSDSSEAGHTSISFQNFLSDMLDDQDNCRAYTWADDITEHESYETDVSPFCVTDSLRRLECSTMVKVLSLMCLFQVYGSMYNVTMITLFCHCILLILCKP